ncbi:MAG: TraB/GumN family protein, partial [Gammaproteobacteria bacterium]|nr:TraB/GumN family protein [Gammaproteobacteria bacterium]
VPSELYRDAISAMAERGYPEAFTARLHPWAVLLTLSMPQPKTGQFLDKVLYDRAIEQGKAIQGLESVDEQLAIFRELSLADQQVLLEQTLQDYQQLPELMEAMTRAWLERDMDQLVALNRENMQGLPEALRQRFGQRLVEERNHRMAERALALLQQQGGVFIAVGAMHLPGEEGLVALLREQDMTLTPVY